MQTLEYKTKKVVGKRSRSSDRLPAPFFEKNKSVGSISIKKVSSLLLFAYCLPVLFTYRLIKEKESIYSPLVQFLLLIFLEINVLFMDFALWNYYESKKIFLLWLIEASLVFLLLYYLIF